MDVSPGDPGTICQDCEGEPAVWVVQFGDCNDDVVVTGGEIEEPTTFESTYMPIDYATEVVTVTRT